MKYCLRDLLSRRTTLMLIKILLRFEKYPHRMNFSKGILESRKQHYKHLAKLLVCYCHWIYLDVHLD
jgi:hypothetical protein